MVPFLVEEEEELVALDGTADGVAIVIAAQFVLAVERLARIGVALGKVGKGRQCVVTTAVKQGSMEGVCSVASGNADNGSRGLAIFRTVAVGQHLELCNGFNRRVDQDRTVGTYVVVIGTIDQEEIIRRWIAVNREVHATL